MTRLTVSSDLDQLDFAKSGGLVTVVAQDAESGAVLMVAHADRGALERTLATGEMHYRSRTRGEWHKGATSGNVQRVVELRYDCDGDAVLATVLPAGPACHTGSDTCFGAPSIEGAATNAIRDLDRTIAQRAADSSDSGSYTRRLLGDRNLRLKKLGEEAAELIVACADGDSGRAASEAADLLYHTLVALRSVDVGWSEVTAELAARTGVRRAPGS